MVEPIFLIFPFSLDFIYSLFEMLPATSNTKNKDDFAHSAFFSFIATLWKFHFVHIEYSFIYQEKLNCYHYIYASLYSSSCIYAFTAIHDHFHRDHHQKKY